MRLILVRHGSRERGKPDSSQRLTAAGEKEVETLERLFAAMEITPTRCFASRFTHAETTANHLWPDNRHAKGPALLSSLTPRDSRPIGDFVQEVQENMNSATIADDETVLVVGHEP